MLLLLVVMVVALPLNWRPLEEQQDMETWL
jgi:hypothetical protein